MWDFTDPHFLLFGLKIKIYKVNLRIQSKIEKKRTRKHFVWWTIFTHCYPSVLSRKIFPTTSFCSDWLYVRLPCKRSNNDSIWIALILKQFSWMKNKLQKSIRRRRSKSASKPELHQAEGNFYWQLSSPEKNINKQYAVFNHLWGIKYTLSEPWLFKSLPSLGCRDTRRDCPVMERMGYCYWNRDWMKITCPKSCKFCGM